MSLSVDGLVGYQRAEFNRASRYQIAALVTQFMITLVAIASIFVSDPKPTYGLTLTAVTLGAIWLFLRGRYDRYRSQAEKARRATLIMGGLGWSISPTELSELEESFSVDADAARSCEDQDYFSSDTPPGPKRLIEILEESAFWTRDLHVCSAQVAWGLFWFVLIVTVLIFAIALPYADNKFVLSSARVVFAVLTLLITTEFYSFARGYVQSARELDLIIFRIDSIMARNFPETDVLLILSDYNTAVQNAPLTLPYVYNRRRAHLNARWRQRTSHREQQTP